MSLPIMKVPTYETELLSEAKKVKYRPWIVSEMKVLMLALETGSRADLVNAAINIVNSCTFESLDMAKLPVFDLERLFLLIRTRSVGENIDVGLKCKNCGESNPATINLLDMKIDNLDNITNKIQLADDYTFVMRYPNSKDLMTSLGKANPTDLDFYYQLTKICLLGVGSGGEYYSATDTSQEDLTKLLDGLDNTAMAKIQRFFDTMPSVSYYKDFTCKKCGAANTTKLEGIDSFFG